MIPSLAVALARDLIRVLFRSRTAVIAENLFLRRQLALYQERKIRRRRPNSAAKFALVILSRFFPWASALSIVKPDTLVRWHRAGFRLFWRWKSRHAGRPPLPKNLRTLIVNMAQENPIGVTNGEAPAVLAPCRSRDLRGFGYVWHVGFREEPIQLNLWHYEPMAKSSVESSDGSRFRLPQDRRSKM